MIDKLAQMIGRSIQQHTMPCIAPAHGADAADDLLLGLGDGDAHKDGTEHLPGSALERLIIGQIIRTKEFNHIVIAITGAQC